MGKKGFRGVPVGEVIDKAVPRLSPPLLVDKAFRCHPFMPPQGEPSCSPKLWIEPWFVHTGNTGGVVIAARPCGACVVRSCLIGVHAVRPVAVVPAFSGFFEYLFESHACSPLAFRGHGGTVAHIARVSPEDHAGS